MSQDSIHAYDLNPCDVLVLERVPTLDNYLREWFASCEREAIDFAPPRVKVSHEVAVCHATLWFPELGLCKINTPLPCWEVSEPFASQGDFTRRIHFWELELLTQPEVVPEDLQQLMASRFQHKFSHGVPIEHRLITSYQTPEVTRFVRQQEQTQVEREPLGVLCLFERDTFRRHWYGDDTRQRRSLDRHRCRGEESTAHYLLSHTVMTQATDVLASDRTMRVIIE